MILGLTGGIASGKSTVSRLLEGLGAVIIDADKIARGISGSREVIDGVKEKFGREFVKAKDGIEILDRKKLKDEIFKDKGKRELLNSLIHPLVVKIMKEKIKEVGKDKLIILDIPLLYESGLEYLCNKVVVVWVGEAIQIDRIVERDSMDKELATRIISSQMSIEEKLKRADFDIENSGTLLELEEKIEVLYKKICKK